MKQLITKSILILIICASFVPLYSMELAEYDGTVSIGYCSDGHGGGLFYDIEKNENGEYNFSICPKVAVVMEFNKPINLPDEGLENISRLHPSLSLLDVCYLKKDVIKELNISISEFPKLMKFKCINNFDQILSAKVQKFQNTFLSKRVPSLLEYDSTLLLNLIKSNVIRFVNESDVIRYVEEIGKNNNILYENIPQGAERIKSLCEGKCTWGRNGFISMEHFKMWNNLTPKTQRCWMNSVLLLCHLYQLEQQ